MLFIIMIIVTLLTAFNLVLFCMLNVVWREISELKGRLLRRGL